MTWRIEFSTPSLRFLKKEKLKEADILSYIRRAINKLRG